MLNLGVYCCCPCPDALELTLAGVNAGVCLYDCYNVPGGTITKSHEAFTALDIDGTLSGINKSADGSPCEYYSTAGGDFGMLEIQNYSDVDCVTATTTPSFSSRFTYITADATKVYAVEVYTMTGANRIEIFGWSGTASYGDSLPNQLTCDAASSNPVTDGGVASSTGTAVVEKA